MNEWEINHVYQGVWASHFCWSKPIQMAKGWLKMVHYKMCTKIEGLGKSFLFKSLIH